jgi:hypothetical protein
MSVSRGFVGSVVASLFAGRTSPRPEVATLRNWWCSAKEDQAAREIEARLFFDPVLVRDARHAQRADWKRVLTAAILGMAVWVTPVGIAHAEESRTVEEDVAMDHPDIEIAIWEWLVDVVMQSAGGAREGSGSEDPDDD